MIQINLFAEQKQTHRLCKTFGYQMGQVEGEMDWVCSDWHMHTVVYGMIGH